MNKTYPLFLLAGFACSQPSPEPATSDALALLARSEAFHDPNGHWGSSPIATEWFGTNPDGTERVAVLVTQQPNGSTFDMVGRYRGATINYHTDSVSWSATVDGEADLDSATIERMRLHREDGFFWRSYYGFLSGLPMKLRDPGTNIDPDTTHATFQGQDVVTIRVTYDEDVGGDTWYFYFDPETAQLVGCRFYHDESANDGEYLVFEGVEESYGLRLPKRRGWYMNADDRYLGTDEIRSVAVAVR